MKNKKLTYILLPVVLLVWGLVIYRLFFEGKTTPENITNVVKPVLNNADQQKENKYRLLANYSDPFLKNIEPTINQEETEKKSENENLENLRRRRTSISRIRWPEIKYGGYIDGNGRNKKTILLSIQNKDYLCNTGDTIANVQIKEFYGDSILVVYNDEEKTLKK